MVYVLVVARIKPEWAPPIDQEILAQISRQELTLKVMKALVPPLTLMVAVLGSIFAGVASPTEAASVGAIGATLLTVLHRRFSMKIILEVMDATTKLTCMVFIILVGATTLGLVFRGLGGDGLVRELIAALPFGKWGVLLIVMTIILYRRLFPGLY